MCFFLTPIRIDLLQLSYESTTTVILFTDKHLIDEIKGGKCNAGNRRRICRSLGDR